MLSVSKFIRKPFYVEAVQVTAENIEDIAKWCMGEVRVSSSVSGSSPSTEEKYIKVRVYRPLNERQTKAFIGDWILYAGTGFKVYTDKAFDKSFELYEGSLAGSKG